MWQNRWLLHEYLAMQVLIEHLWMTRFNKDMHNDYTQKKIVGYEQMNTHIIGH